ncbi:MAG: O-antigen ligase family protein [Burkholderiales bacterium]
MGRSIELVFLVLLLFSLPTLEAPKNVFCLLYFLAWTINRARTADWGGPFDGWDAVIWYWISSGFVAGLFSDIPRIGWTSGIDPLRYGLLLWSLKRSGYSFEVQVRLLVVAVISSLLSLAIGLWQLFVSHNASLLILNSVGHVNHGAIYLSISLTIAVALTFSFWREWRAVVCGLAGIAALILFSGVLLTSSRGAIAASVFAILVMALAFVQKFPRFRVSVLVACLALVAIGVVRNDAVVRKHQELAQTQNAMSFRPQIWNVALEAWREYPLTGVGMDNFSQITPDRLRTWRANATMPIDESRYFFTSHAHSLFFNTLAERGLYGFSALALLLFAWVFSLIRKRPTAKSSNSVWAVWGASAGTFLVDVVAGSFNTTLHHEHAILSALCLGCWLSQSQGKNE